MSNEPPTLSNSANAPWSRLLEWDNNILGIAVCALAVFEWAGLFNGIERARLFSSQGFYALSSLTVLSIFFSAVYMSVAGIILLSLKRPVLRYRTIWPNLVAILAAFSVYLLAIVPSGSLLGVSVYVALALVILGTVLVLASMVFLRRAFSVTPQARHLVTSGPYSVVRHPMYLGNIISLLGATFLIDSWQAVVLFFICSGLQVGRAHYDEKILHATFSEYAVYKDSVGAFIPRVGTGKRLAAAAIVLCALCCCLAAVSVANAADDWAAQCQTWAAAVAKPGTWLSAKQRQTIAAAQTNLQTVTTCQSFATLWSKCTSYEKDWTDQSVSDGAFVSELEGLSGCSAIVGFNNVCKALEAMSGTGATLNDLESKEIAACFAADLKKNPIRSNTSIRGGM
jgi:protein-S-isoprenylcysteine O-methyltransferase Ste14